MDTKSVGMKGHLSKVVVTKTTNVGGCVGCMIGQVAAFPALLQGSGNDVAPDDVFEVVDFVEHQQLDRTFLFPVLKILPRDVPAPADPFAGFDFTRVEDEADMAATWAAISAAYGPLEIGPPPELPRPYDLRSSPRSPETPSAPVQPRAYKQAGVPAATDAKEILLHRGRQVAAALPPPAPPAASQVLTAGVKPWPGAVALPEASAAAKTYTLHVLYLGRFQALTSDRSKYWRYEFADAWGNYDSVNVFRRVPPQLSQLQEGCTYVFANVLITYSSTLPRRFKNYNFGDPATVKDVSAGFPIKLPPSAQLVVVGDVDQQETRAHVCFKALVWDILAEEDLVTGRGTSKRRVVQLMDKDGDGLVLSLWPEHYRLLHEIEAGGCYDFQGFRVTRYAPMPGLEAHDLSRVVRLDPASPLALQLSARAASFPTGYQLTFTPTWPADTSAGHMVCDLTLKAEKITVGTFVFGLDAAVFGLRFGDPATPLLTRVCPLHPHRHLYAVKDHPELLHCYYQAGHNVPTPHALFDVDFYVRVADKTGFVDLHVSGQPDIARLFLPHDAAALAAMQEDARLALLTFPQAQVWFGRYLRFGLQVDKRIKNDAEGDYVQAEATIITVKPCTVTEDRVLVVSELQQGWDDDGRDWAFGACPIPWGDDRQVVWARFIDQYALTEMELEGAVERGEF
jgi:hypothetical protein